MPVGANAGIAGLNVTVGVNLQQFNSAMSQVEQRGQQAASSLNKVGSALTTGAGIGAGFAVANAALSSLSNVAGAAGSAVIGLNSQLEQARIGFTAFTRDGEKANNFIKQLQQFAATTTFEFPGLLQASRQLMGMGVQAEAVIPMLKSVGAAVMAMGGGEVEIKRVNRALTQMIATGRVQADEMNQLAEAGIPAWDMLAKSMGKTRGEVIAMSKQGKVMAEDMLQAFVDFGQNMNLGEVFENAGKTWQAATSNIIDGLRNVGAEGLEPLFNVLRDYAVGIADFLTKSQTVRDFTADLKATMQDLVTSAQPVGAALSRAFEAFKTDGVTGAIKSIVTDIGNMAGDMGSAGLQLISEFAGGIISGAQSLITDAATYVADIIASFLIGQSPPPQGPLANITQGGAAVIQAYVDGMREGATGVSDVAMQIVDALGQVDGAMTFAQGRAALQEAANNIKELESALKDTEGVLRGLDSQIRDNQSAMQDYRNAADDIKDAYSAAIDPLQRQLEALRETTDLTQKQADIQDRIAVAQLKGALQRAQGDPVQRARLQTRLDELEQQEKDLTLQERALSLTKQASDIQNKDRVNQLRDAAAAAKKAGDADKAKRLTEEAAAAARGNTATSAQQNALAQQRLRIQQEQNQIQQQISGMVDKEAVARIKAQQAQVQAVSAQRDINQEIESLNRELQAAPIQAQIKELQSQQEALLTPIQQRIKETEREGQALQAQRQHWQDLKSAISDALQEQKRLATEAKQEAKEAEKAAKAQAQSATPRTPGDIFGTQAITAQAQKAGESWLNGLRDYLNTRGAGILGGVIGTVLGGATFGPLGAIAGGVFGKQFAERMQENFGSLENFFGKLAGKISDALVIDTGAANNPAEAFGIIFETMRDRALTALEQLRSGIAEKLQGAQDVLSGLQGKWQEIFGGESLGAQAGIQAIDGLNKAFQALQLLMSGDVKGAADTLKESFAQFGLAGESGIGQLTQSFTDLKAALEPLVPIAAGVATAFVAFRAGLAIVAGVTALTTAWGAMTTAIASSGGVIAAIVAALGGPVTLVVAAVAAVIGVLAAAWVGNWFGIQEATFTAVAAITQAYTDFTTWLPQATESAMQTMSAAWETGTQTVQTIWETVTTAIPNLLTAMWNLLTPENQTKLQELQTTTQEAWAAIQAIWTTVTTTIMNAFTTWWAQLIERTQANWQTIRTHWDTSLAAIRDAVTPIYEAIITATTTFFTNIQNAWNTAKETLGTAAKVLGDSIMVALTDALNAGVGKVVDAVTGGVRRAIEAAKGLIGQFAGSAGSGNGAQMLSYVTGGSKAGALQDTINRTAGKYGLPANLFTAQLQHESAGFDPRVISGARKGGAGELGLGQFMPGTLTTMLQRNGLTLEQYLNNAEVQIELAAQHMAELVKIFGDYDKALMAYNGGPGGVGSAATQRYANIVKEVAATLQTSNATGSGTQLMSAVGSQMSLNVDQITAGTQAGLSMAEAQAICGPYAAVLFAQATGRTPSLAQAKELAAAVGWTARAGMGGTGNFMSLLGRMGIQAVRQAATPENVNAALAAGNPIALSTPRHYFVGSGGTAQGGINVGATGSVMSRYGGTANMTLAQITEVGGGMNDLIVLTQKLETQGQQTFNNLTRVTGQFGDTLNAEVDGATVDVQEVATAGTQANQQLSTSTQTLAASIQQGMVPAGLAARDAIGGMAIGIQPLIAAWATGQMSSNQLAESIVQLASQTGLATQPLESFKQGNVSVGEALRQVMTQLAQTDPAFAQIQQAMIATGGSTEQLADVLLRGLANVTGQVGPSLQAIAQGAQPIQQAFGAGALSGEQFAQSVVQLAATSGLAQAPLRQMQDGVLTTGQALGQVVSQLAEANPELQTLASTIQEGNAPIEESAQTFLNWVQAQAEAQASTQETSQVIEQIPESVANLQAPLQDASTTALQTLPEATRVALDATLTSIRELTGPAGEAATEVGTAIVEGMRTAVEAGAESLAEAAKAIVEKALEAAKKAADAVKKESGKGGGGGGDDDDTEERARGGKLTPGVWTLVGEEGPELISPNGYVYNTGETTDMLLRGVNSGLFTLNKFAKGGKSKKSSKKEKSSKSSSSSAANNTETAPKRITYDPSGPELDLERGILELTVKRSQQLVAMLPIEEAIRQAKIAQEDAARGTLEQQMQIAHQTYVIASVDQKIAELRFRDTQDRESTYNLEVKLKRMKDAQQQAARGDRNVRQELLRLDLERLQNEQKIAEINYAARFAREALADIEREIAAIQKGSVEDQLQAQQLSAQRNKNQLTINGLQIQAAPLQQEEARLQREIERTLAGSAEQRAAIAANATRIAQYDAQSAAEQLRLLPIQKQIADVTHNIEAAERGTLQQQYASLDAEREAAKLRLQEIAINGKLRDVNAGTLKLSQTEINTLHEQLEVIENQKEQIQDQSEIRQLTATINTTDAKKMVASLQEQGRQHEFILENIDYERQMTQAQTTNIQSQNQVSAAGQQERLTSVQTQLAVFTDQITELEAQNAVLDLQVQNIQLGNQIRADALGAQLISLQAQVGQYDAQIVRVQSQNNLIAAQSGLLNANNAVAAAGHAAAIDTLEQTLEMRQTEIDQLEDEKGYLQGQITLTQTQLDTSKLMHEMNVLSLEAQKLTQSRILEDINAQLGALNAQKQVYEDIRRLAEQIANRPANPPAAPPVPGQGGASGPPGTVVATATKNGEPTLYLSRGTGTDGWYTSGGQLIVQGGTVNPPSGYRVRWLAEGGTWHRGEMAVLGEEGPEIAIAKEDMHVFPHEKSESIARAFGRASTFRRGSSDEASKNVVVNVEYHRHGGQDHGQATVQQVVREAVNVALRS